MAVLSVDNINIHYEFHQSENEENEGTLILIHGYLSSTFSFRHLVPFLKERFSVAMFDLPGFGASEKSKHFLYSIEHYGKLVLSLMDKLGVGKATLLGHSMGGQVALQAAKQNPSRIDKLVLLASSGYLKPFSRWLVMASYLPLFPWIVRKGFEKREAREVLLQVVYDSNLIDQTMIDGYVNPMLEKNFYHSLVRLLRHHGGDMAAEDLGKIQTPAMLIWGKEDRIVPVEIGKRLSQDLPNASLAVYENTGHLVPEEKPEEVYLEICKFQSHS